MPGPLLSSARTWPESINAAATTATVKSRRMPHALTRDLVRAAAGDAAAAATTSGRSRRAMAPVDGGRRGLSYGLHQRARGDGRVDRSHRRLSGKLLYQPQMDLRA